MIIYDLSTKAYDSVVRRIFSICSIVLNRNIFVSTNYFAVVYISIDQISSYIAHS